MKFREDIRESFVSETGLTVKAEYYSPPSWGYVNWMEDKILRQCATISKLSVEPLPAPDLARMTACVHGINYGNCCPACGRGDGLISPNR